MDVVLIILGVLGFGAIVIAAYVFTVAARNYVSDNGHPSRESNDSAMPGGFVKRRVADRRRAAPVAFPLTINSAVIQSDRRQLPDRRQAA